LSATGDKVKGLQKADLTWSATTNVNVTRDGNVIAENVTNNGTYTDNISAKGSGSYSYQVCEAGSTTTCSNTVLVAF
jgi:hypothetical protein